MITMTTLVAPTPGTRLWVESVARYGSIVKQRPSAVTLDGIAFPNSTDHNSTGVSAVRRRHR